MLLDDALNTLRLMCNECLCGGTEDIADLFDLLKGLDKTHFIYFRDWLKATDPLLYARVKRAQQRHKKKEAINAS